MRIAGFLRKGVLKTTVGGILNNINIRSRRDTLFFEEIGAGYVEQCEKAGYAREMEAIGEKWMALYFKYLLPAGFRSMPPKFFLNVIVKKIWVSVGMMAYFHMSENDGLFEINTVNEGLTRCVGRNSLMTGFYKGILSSLFGTGFRTADVSQSRERCRYLFERTGEPFAVVGKSKPVYDRLNRIEGEGFTLNDALRSRLLEMKGNMICFRGKSIFPIENTLFHLIGAKGIMMERITAISSAFFKDIIDMESPEVKKALLLKTLLQVMGWGMTSMAFRGDNVYVSIRHPAYGMQLEKDNWDFLAHTILGYLRLHNEKFDIVKTEEGRMKLKIVYAR